MNCSTTLKCDGVRLQQLACSRGTWAPGLRNPQHLSTHLGSTLEVPQLWWPARLHAKVEGSGNQQNIAGVDLSDWGVLR